MAETVQILPTANPEWGAWGTATRAGYDAALVWETASRALREGLFGLCPAGARAILDGRWGRHWVDSLPRRAAGDSALVRRHLLDTLEAWGTKDIAALLGDVDLLPAGFVRVPVEDTQDPLDLEILRIAGQQLGIHRLRAIGVDRCDFHDVSVEALGRALRAAWEAGCEFGRESD